jgi:predicted amidohydrolase YtcJ
MSQIQPTLFYNGIIYPTYIQDHLSTPYQWMVIKSNEIVSLGFNPPPHHLYDKEINLNQTIVLPGLIDSHLHVYLLGHSKRNCNIRNLKSIEQLQSTVQSYIQLNSTNTWYRADGWEQDLLSRYPTRKDLDVICDNKPLILFRICTHICVVNR